MASSVTMKSKPHQPHGSSIMNRLLSPILVVVALTGAASALAAELTDEQKKLQGSWRPTDARLGDIKIDEETLQKITFAYMEDRFTLTPVSSERASAPLPARVVIVTPLLPPNAEVYQRGISTVTFAAPGTGASGAFTGGQNTAITDPTGAATSVVFTANSKAGSYSITATVGSVSTTFAMTNQAGPATSIAVTAGSPQRMNPRPVRRSAVRHDAPGSAGRHRLLPGDQGRARAASQ
jgi:hypothetical protein